MTLFLADALREFGRQTRPLVVANAAITSPEEDHGPGDGEAARANEDDVCLVLGLAGDASQRK